MYAYVTLKEGIDTDPELLMSDLKKSVKDKIASYAVPEIMQVKSTFEMGPLKHLCYLSSFQVNVYNMGAQSNIAFLGRAGIPKIHCKINFTLHSFHTTSCKRL